MGSASVRADLFTYNAAISACEKGSQWESALRLFENAHRDCMQVDAVTFNATISSCEKSLMAHGHEDPRPGAVQRSGTRSVSYGVTSSSRERSSMGHGL